MATASSTWRFQNGATELSLRLLYFSGTAGLFQFRLFSGPLYDINQPASSIVAGDFDHNGSVSSTLLLLTIPAALRVRAKVRIPSCLGMETGRFKVP